MPTQHTTQLDRIHIAYEHAGDNGAPPMLLLHALGERATQWSPVRDVFAAHFSVYAADLRGHGDSDWPGEYSFRLMRDDVVQLVDRLGLSRITIVGHSIGGIVAYLVAMHRPGLCEKLVVEDAPPPYTRDHPIPERPVEPLDFDWEAVPALLSEANVGDPAAWEGLPAIDAPTLLIGGGTASHIDQNKLREAASRIPSCTMATIEAGHMVHASRPEEFAQTVLEWLTTTPGREV